MGTATIGRSAFVKLSASSYAMIVISGLQVHTEETILKDSSVLIAHQKISELSTKISDTDVIRLNFPSDFHLIPGRIDLHIHGSGGADFMDATKQALMTMQTSLAADGVTSFLATTVSESPLKISQALQNLNDYQQENAANIGVEILGVHLEGPFISPRQIGAHRADTLLAPNLTLLDTWQKYSGNRIKWVTLAPELKGGLDFIRALIARGIKVAIGHSDADFSTTELAIAAGAHHATHLFNAMRGFHHRDPGCLGALLLNSEVSVELIIDGHHVHPAAVNLALRNKDKSKIILVTDGMRARCCESMGEFDLGGQAVIVRDGAARLKTGVLAGSVLTMTQAVKNLLAFTGCDLHESIRFTSVNPAKSLGVFDRKGSIAPGKEADLVVLNENYDVVLTLCRGEIAYQSQQFPFAGNLKITH